MADKEIIIDGVDVSGCGTYKNGKCLITKARCNARCDHGIFYLYEQLVCKTAECEGLGDKIKFMEGYIKTVENARSEIEQECKHLETKIKYNDKQEVRWCKAWFKIWKQRNHYRKALDEIEEYFKNECVSCKEQYYNQHCGDCETQYFLDAISKAKDKKNENTRTD